jgi:hypothetical protein
VDRNTILYKIAKFILKAEVTREWLFGVICRLLLPAVKNGRMLVGKSTV